MKLTLITLFLTTILTSCKWFESLKPKETFFCKVNGVKFRPDKDTSPIGGIGSEPLSVKVDKDNNWLYIRSRKTPALLSISIKLNNNNLIEKKEFMFENDITKTSGSYYTDFTVEQNKLERLISYNGKVIFTNIDGFSLSGTFEFDCKSTKTGKIYKITEGEFNDISYY